MRRVPVGLKTRGSSGTRALGRCGVLREFVRARWVRACVRVAWSAARPPRLRRFLHPAVLKKRTESEKYLVPSATDCKVCTLFQKRARSIRSTRQLGWRENLRILRLAFYRRYVLIGRPTEFIDGAFTVSVKFTDRPDFNDVLRSDFQDLVSSRYRHACVPSLKPRTSASSNALARGARPHRRRRRVLPGR